MSNFAKTLCKNFGVQQNLSTAFHPCTDRQTEWMNAWVKQYLRPWMTLRQNNWARPLPIAEYAHNSWRSDTTRKSPYELLIGIKLQVDVKFLDDSMPATINWLKTLETTRQEVQKLFEQCQQHKDFKKLMEMKVGEWVWLENWNLLAIRSWKLQP